MNHSPPQYLMQPNMRSAVELRSEEVQDILTALPNWLTRWGNLVILSIITGLLLIAWFVRYPDVVTGSATLTTLHEPAYVYARTSGNVRVLQVGEGAYVHEGQLLAEISSSLKQHQVDDLQRRLQAARAVLAGTLATLPLEVVGTASLGELQPGYNMLREQLNSLAQLNAPYYAAAASRVQANAARYTQSVAIYKAKLDIMQRELDNARQRYQAQQQLYANKVIAHLDLLKEESAYNQKINDVADVRQNIVQTSQLLANEQKQLAEMHFNSSESRRKLHASCISQIKFLEAQIQRWKQLSDVLAPASGQVVFLEKFSPGFYARADKPLLAIVPSNEQFVAKVKVPASRYGKIKTGQRVRLALDNYPFQEYGFLFGIVSEKSYIPVEKHYELIVLLPHSLHTSYQHHLAYKPAMPATADIIVEEQRLLERLFYSVRQLLQR